MQQAILRQYLTKIVGSADYQNDSVRPVLIERLNAVLALAHTDEVFRKFSLDVMRDALQTCGDRIVLALNTVELEVYLKEAKSRPKPQRAVALEELGLSLMKLSIVHTHAARSYEEMQHSDDVEIYLAYETKLRERLRLPGKTVSMLYKSFVKDESIEAAAQDAEQQCSDPAMVHAFFATWTPWQQHLRQTLAESLSFEKIPQRIGLPVAAANEPRLCTITQEAEDALVQPVYLGDKGNVRVYEYADLITWWVEHGREPASFTAFALEQLWRAAK